MVETFTFSLMLLAFILAVGFILLYRALRELHLTMNSRLDELVRTAKQLARAEGFREGQESAGHDELSALRKAGESLDSSEDG
jgi:hypothetical protein